MKPGEVCTKLLTTSLRMRLSSIQRRALPLGEGSSPTTPLNSKTTLSTQLRSSRKQYLATGQEMKTRSTWQQSGKKIPTLSLMTMKFITTMMMWPLAPGHQSSPTLNTLGWVTDHTTPCSSWQISFTVAHSSLSQPQPPFAPTLSCSMHLPSAQTHSLQHWSIHGHSPMSPTFNIKVRYHLN